MKAAIKQVEVRVTNQDGGVAVYLLPAPEVEILVRTYGGVRIWAEADSSLFQYEAPEDDR